MFPNLPLGSYTVTIQKAGFDTERHPDVILNAGTEATIDAQLKIGAVGTMIEVSGGAPVVDPSRVSTGRTIGFEETNNLPLTSRNPYNFILFQPGVSGHPNPELGIPRLLTQMALWITSIISWTAPWTPKPIGTGCAYLLSPTVT